MNLRLLLAGVLGFTLLAAPQTPVPAPDVRELLAKLNHIAADPCTADPSTEHDFPDLRVALFAEAENAVVAALNSSSDGAPRDRAAAALRRFEQMSAEVNAAWPGQSRFHFQIFEVQPVLVVTLEVRDSADYFAVGAAHGAWYNLGSGMDRNDLAASTSIELHPLHRGPSGNPRFLANISYSGCAGSIAIAYDAEEWKPDAPALTRILHQEGSLGLDDQVHDFPQVGKLDVSGAIVRLPYCWFSPIDTWDNPSLCALDTYDLSGDSVVFRGHRYNRPDLLPVAKAIEYAQAHDLPAVRGYCASDAVAQALVKAVSSHFFADDLKVTRLSPTRERVQAGDDPVFRFDVEQRAGRWLVTAFTARQLQK